MTAVPVPVPSEVPKLNPARPILRATGLQKRYGHVQAVRAVSLDLYPGEVLGIVGESGSGKSSVMRLLNLEERPDAGSYMLGDHADLFALSRREQRAARVRDIGIVYQNPHLGLRLRHSSSGNIAERLLTAGERNFATLRGAARDSLSACEFPLGRMDDPPIQLSGGMQQRVQLAKAIALEPKLLLLDEPTTGLDVSVQARVLDTLRQLQAERQVSMIIVSHDLGVIRTLADRVMVMKQGEVVERGLTDQVLEDPQHAYTQQLVHAKL